MPKRKTCEPRRGRNASAETGSARSAVRFGRGSAFACVSPRVAAHPCASLRVPPLPVSPAFAVSYRTVTPTACIYIRGQAVLFAA